MPDITELLETHAAQLVVETPDVGVIAAGARSRRRRQRGAVVALIGAVALIVASPLLIPQTSPELIPAAPPVTSAPTAPTPVDPSLFQLGIYALRTGAGGSELVANFWGGNCDVGAQLEAVEAAARIDIRVISTGPGPAGCDSFQNGRYLTARTTLASPLGTREIWSGTRKLTPFDGDSLRQPSHLPTGFELLPEVATGPESLAEASKASVVTTSWQQVFGVPADDTEGGGCPSARGRLTIQQGTNYVPFGVELSGLATTVQIGAATADLIESSTGTAVTDRTLIWDADGQTFVVHSSPSCSGDEVLSADELIAVARSLGTS